MPYPVRTPQFEPGVPNAGRRSELVRADRSRPGVSLPGYASRRFSRYAPMIIGTTHQIVIVMYPIHGDK